MEKKELEKAINLLNDVIKGENEILEKIGQFFANRGLKVFKNEYLSKGTIIIGAGEKIEIMSDLTEKNN